MIIDAHAHLGTCRVTDLDVREEALLQKMDENGVDALIVQPLPGAPDAPAVHDQIADLGARYPGRFYGLASFNPHRPEDEYRAEITRCVRDLGFVGVKVHTYGHAVNLMGRDAEMIFRVARDLGIAVMIHTGLGIPLALPALSIPLAQRYPEVPVVLAHAGWGIFSAEALVAAQACPNIFLEPSWCQSTGILGMVRTLGAERVMFGADMPLNQGPELATFREIGLTEAELDQCLWKTAASVFKLPVQAGAGARNGSRAAAQA